MHKGKEGMTEFIGIFPILYKIKTLLQRFYKIKCVPL